MIFETVCLVFSVTGELRYFQKVLHYDGQFHYCLQLQSANWSDKRGSFFDNFSKYKTFVKVKYYADYKHNLKLKL